MKGLLELIKILSMITALGAAFWAGLAVISTSAEFGDPSNDPSGALQKSGIVFVIAVAINVFAGRIARRFG